MAVTDSQVAWWRAQNPTATPVQEMEAAAANGVDTGQYMRVKTLMDGQGTVTAPTPGATPTQNQWWNSGTGLIGSVNNATGTGYTANTANAGQANTTNATSTGYTGAKTTAGNASQTSAGLTNWNVDSNQLVDNQVSRIIDQDSGLMQRAKARANQAANSRGLINSSMAVGAGQAAVLDAAMPMAQQNAQTYANSAQTNAGAANQNAMFNAGQANDISKTNAGLIQQTNLANQASENAANQFASSASNTASLANASAANDTSKTNASLTQQANLANADAKNTAAQFTSAAGNTASLANAQAANALQNQSNTIRQQTASADYDAQIKLSMQDLDNKLKAAMQNADAQTKAYLTQLDGTVKADLATIEANYKTIMQTSATASDMYRGAVDNIAKIAADPNMDAASKSSTITALQNYLKGGLNLVGSVNGMDFGQLLNFSNQNIATADGKGESPSTVINTTSNTTNLNGVSPEQVTSATNTLNTATRQLSNAESMEYARLYANSPTEAAAYAKKLGYTDAQITAFNTLVSAGQIKPADVGTKPPATTTTAPPATTTTPQPTGTSGGMINTPTTQLGSPVGFSKTTTGNPPWATQFLNSFNTTQINPLGINTFNEKINSDPFNAQVGFYQGVGANTNNPASLVKATGQMLSLLWGSNAMTNDTMAKILNTAPAVPPEQVSKFNQLLDSDMEKAFEYGVVNVGLHPIELVAYVLATRKNQ